MPFSRLPQLAIFLACLIPAVPWAAPAPEMGKAAVGKQAGFTLEEAISLALEKNPTLSAARSESASTEGAVTQAGVLPNPSLDLGMDDTQMSTRTTTAMVTMPIELGGKRAARIKAAQLSRDASQRLLAATRAEIRSAAIAAYFRVAVAQDKLRLAGDTVKIAENALSLADKRVEAGKSPPLERSKAQVELSTARIEAKNAEVQLQDARRSLGALWGDVDPGFPAVQVELDRPPPRPAIDELRAALSTAPRLEAGRLNVAVGEANLQVEKSKRYPDITIGAGMSRDNELGRNRPQLGLSIPLPLFDRNQGNVYSAQMQAYKARDEYRQLETTITAELLAAVSRFDLAAGSLREFRDSVLPGAAESYRAARLGFEAGKVGFLEVLDAQRTLSQSRNSYLSVLETVYQSSADMDRILGR
ncbi:TolC family protein [Achromobacter aloeverae]